MALTFRNPVKMEGRRARSLDHIATTDALVVGLGMALVRKADRTEPFGPPAFAPLSSAVLDYYTRKRRAVRAEQFRLRYGRDYWTSRPRHPSRVRVIRRLARERDDA